MSNQKPSCKEIVKLIGRYSGIVSKRGSQADEALALRREYSHCQEFVECAEIIDRMKAAVSGDRFHALDRSHVSRPYPTR